VINQKGKLKRGLAMLTSLYQKTKCLLNQRRSISQAFRGLSRKEQNLHLDHEILNLEKLFFTTKMQKLNLNIKSIWLRIQTITFKRIFFTQCQKHARTYERSKPETQWCQDLSLKRKPSTLEIRGNRWTTPIRTLRNPCIKSRTNWLD